jgi:putative glutamine amidotransferase
MILGLTDIMQGQDALDNYLAWIEQGSPRVEPRILKANKAPAAPLDGCDGLLLTGGGDVHPKFYRNKKALALARGVRVERDEFEFRLIREALARRLPILGICRGCQVFNVAKGGTLVPDLESAGFGTHAKATEGNRTHAIRINAESGLHALLGGGGLVNTSHHQAVDKPGRDLRVVATADDGVVEGLDWRDPMGKSWMMMVQWHPERAWGDSHSFSEKILMAFLNAMDCWKRE